MISLSRDIQKRWSWVWSCSVVNHSKESVRNGFISPFLPIINFQINNSIGTGVNLNFPRWFYFLDSYFYFSLWHRRLRMLKDGNIVRIREFWVLFSSLRPHLIEQMKHSFLSEMMGFLSYKDFWIFYMLNGRVEDVKASSQLKARLERNLQRTPFLHIRCSFG